MDTSNYLYYLGDQEFHGFLAFDDMQDEPRPAVLVAHDWSGRNELACQRAIELAEMGYVAFAIDMYGQGRVGTTTNERMALMEPLISDRRIVRDRIRAAFDTVVGMSEVDTKRIAAIGFCFGGLCVLDLARSGAEINGVVSFHGLLNPPKDLKSHAIHAKVLALHGYDDPMVRPQQVNEFCEEMTAAEVDWQMHMFGHTEHAFTNPHAQDPKAGTVYNAASHRRSWLAMSNFLEELFI